jgi:hypothetical protein
MLTIMAKAIASARMAVVFTILTILFLLSPPVVKAWIRYYKAFILPCVNIVKNTTKFQIKVIFTNKYGLCFIGKMVVGLQTIKDGRKDQKTSVYIMFYILVVIKYCCDNFWRLAAC